MLYFVIETLFKIICYTEIIKARQHMELYSPSLYSGAVLLKETKKKIAFKLTYCTKLHLWKFYL